jgi:hypothetical protein
MEFKEIISALDESISKLSITKDSNDIAIANHLKYIRSLALIVANIFDSNQLHEH